MSSVFEKILREEISRRLDEIFAGETTVAELTEKFPRVQTHAAPTSTGLSESRKRTMVSQLISIPVGKSRIIPTKRGISNAKHVSRIRGHQSWIAKGHGVRLSVYTVPNGARVTRVA